MRLRKILYVEDNPMDVELTLEALRENNLANQVVWVRDGVEALEYLTYQGEFKTRSQETPGVILLDLKLPRMGGLEFLEIVRTNPELACIPIVILTSSREEQDLVRGYKLGVNAYVVKPVDFAAFLEAVKQIGGFWGFLNELPPEKG